MENYGLVVCKSSDNALYVYENILNGFQVIEQTRLRDGRMDRQTDRQPMQKQNLSTPVRGRYNYDNKET